jgi:hypothetical protein
MIRYVVITFVMAILLLGVLQLNTDYTSVAGVGVRTSTPRVTATSRYHRPAPTRTPRLLLSKPRVTPRIWIQHAPRH